MCRIRPWGRTISRSSTRVCLIHPQRVSGCAIPSHLGEAQTLLWRKGQGKAGSSGKHRPRNDNFVIFFGTCRQRMRPTDHVKESSNRGVKLLLCSESVPVRTWGAAMRRPYEERARKTNGPARKAALQAESNTGWTACGKSRKAIAQGLKPN
jgi:hypothetical protein